jgi:serine/threonine protein kinase
MSDDKNSNKILMNRYQIIKQLGEGSFGQVFECIDIQTKCHVAIKESSIIKNHSHKKDDAIRKKIDRGIDITPAKELSLFHRLKHPNIIQFQAYFYDKETKKRYLVLELGDITLTSFIKRCHLNFESIKKNIEDEYQKYSNESYDKEKDKENKIKIQEIKRDCESFKKTLYGKYYQLKLSNYFVFRNILKGILEGLLYLHKEQQIVHLDIKPSNILLITDSIKTEKGAESIITAKLADFGVSKNLNRPTQFFPQSIGTLIYNAPELLLGCGFHTFQTDLWAVGCIIHDYLLNSHLLYQKSDKEIMHEDVIKILFSKLGTPIEVIWPDVFEYRTAIDLFNKYQYQPTLWDELNKKFDSESDINKEFLSRLFDLMKKLLTYDPNKRYTAEEALSHDFFTWQIPSSSSSNINNRNK